MSQETPRPYRCRKCGRKPTALEWEAETQGQNNKWLKYWDDQQQRFTTYTCPSCIEPWQKAEADQTDATLAALRDFHAMVRFNMVLSTDGGKTWHRAPEDDEQLGALTTNPATLFRRVDIFISEGPHDPGRKTRDVPDDELDRILDAEDHSMEFVMCDPILVLQVEPVTLASGDEGITLTFAPMNEDKTNTN